MADDRRAAGSDGDAGGHGSGDEGGVERRTFLGFLLAAPTLVAAAEIGQAALAPAAHALPSPPGVTDLVDLTDLLTDATLPTASLITVTVHEDGTASFALPRAEVGQGVTTSTAMLIAEELDLPLDKVRVSLADARPELLFNQFTGGSNTTVSTYTPIRVAAATARGQLLHAAATELGDEVADLTTHLGVVSNRAGHTVGYGALAAKAAQGTTKKVAVTLKGRADFTVIGTPRSRVDAREAVTGAKKYAMDLDVPGALPAMLCRPPTINGTVRSVRNAAEVAALPGITDVATVSTGVAVRGETFGQCIDAVRALDVEWGPGTAESASDASVLRELKAAEIPLAVPKVPLLTKTVDASFTFHFRSNSALEPNCAVADVRDGSAEVWGPMKSPIDAQQDIAKRLGLPQHAVTVHVTEGGGSFGRRLFSDAALEAVEVSKAMGKPVKLMWHRTDDFRQGRTHPMCTSRIRATLLGGEILTYEQRQTSVVTEFGHGLGEMITASAARLPVGYQTFSQAVFLLTQEIPYDLGVTTLLLSEADAGFNTGSMRNIYSPDVRCAQELVMDRLAHETGQDPLAFRRRLLKEDRYRAVLDKVAEAGDWGRAMPAGTAQGIALHTEYRSVTASLVEIDCRPETVNRPVEGEAYAGPRVTKAVVAVDVGLPVNPRGLQAQMMGGAMDGIALALSSSLHLQDGHFLEGSWDNYFYTRQWNTPPDVQVFVMPPTAEGPGGAGELGVPATCAAVACAYARATGKTPTDFPLNHAGGPYFEPLPTTPSIPASPTDGLTNRG
ncbi:xanthine dehydrogenase family protein molybdopterin-binding subunit [Streptomyces sp. TS71-3]|uniref:xanthine dehydrogenase family protein molybdopterin-binding subunit n=1 Tax=Streptomyces sp. TS71-3 TaxID=2733862 RepID=UPI001B17C55D|nr:molybdopterin cofactor-binding domain-containing protein [Streptomyces sp. TS71-3]GHJ41658.1 isoquinoline 1-oxidoreductase subunit beta [Streptomyces sp. TS71-3]